MQSIRLKNLRSFIDTKEVPISDINLFVGQNSSGKSTLLRTFPLLRQSILRDTRGPILWYDDTLVDFGSYEEARSRYAPENEGIHFGFKVKISPKNRRYYYYESIRLRREVIVNIDLEIFEKNKKSYIGKIVIDIEGQEIIIEANATGIVKSFYVNGSNLLFTEGTHNLVKFETTGLIPVLFVFNKNDRHVNREYYLLRCKEIIKRIIGNRLKNEKRIDRLIHVVNIGSKQEILDSLKRQSSIMTWYKKVQDWNLDTQGFQELNDLIIAQSTPVILQAIDYKLKIFFEECKYIAPIRAKAIRYYRRQDLSVSEIDAYGDNLHMFLDNLNSKQISNYQKFVSDIFGFTPSTESTKGHITINIKDINGEVFNITDLGFGYSQILPIITKLWYAFSKNESRRGSWESKNKIVTLLIEQPELHLHPAMQGQLADAFIFAIEHARENDIELKLIIETHSSVIINRIGRRIVENKVNPSSVNISLFQLDKNLKNSSILSSGFNKNGVLSNWPLGFFEPKN